MSEQLEERKPKYEVGDMVKVINYGHLIWESKKVIQPRLKFPVVREDENIRWLDMSPELVGQEGIIREATMTQGIPQYSLSGIKGKTAWYDENQLQLVYKNDRGNKEVTE